MKSGSLKNWRKKEKLRQKIYILKNLEIRQKNSDEGRESRDRD